MSGIYIPGVEIPREGLLICLANDDGPHARIGFDEVRPVYIVPDHHGPLIDANEIKFIQVAVLGEGKSENGHQRIFVKNIATAKSIAATSPVIIPAEADVFAGRSERRTDDGCSALRAD